MVGCIVSMTSVLWAGPSSVIPALNAQRQSSGGLKDNNTSAITNEYGMNFAYIPPGEFTMGSPPDEGGRQPNERPHHVVLSQGFYMMTTEVTQRHWIDVMGDNPSAFDTCGPDCPVENISWNMAARFIKKLNRQSKKNGGMSVGNSSGAELPDQSAKDDGRSPVRLRYALPTEAQWEYACRAGRQGWFYFGGDTWGLSEYAWFKNNSGGEPHAVAQKKANAFDLYDMHGNVWEWCRDYAGSYSPKPSVDPTGPKKGTLRIARGGSWYYPALTARCANRLALPPEMGNYNVGFRLALVIEK